MKKGDFDIEKTFGQVVPLRSVRARQDWPLPIQQSGQDQQTLHHNKQEEPDAMIQIPAPAMLSQSVGNRSISHRAIRLLIGAGKRIVRTIIRAKRIAAAQESHRAAGAARMISICRIAESQADRVPKRHGTSELPR